MQTGDVKMKALSEYKYHCEMMLNTLKKMKFKTDTRNYLDVDMGECLILIELLENRLCKYD